MSDELYDAPNQQAVGLDPPWVEGDGGSAGEAPAPPEGNGDLDAMTKDELLAEADARGVDASPAMTKDEIKAAIRAA